MMHCADCHYYRLRAETGSGQREDERGMCVNADVQAQVTLTSLEGPLTADARERYGIRMRGDFGCRHHRVARWAIEGQPGGVWRIKMTGTSKEAIKYFLNVTLKCWCEAFACWCGAHRPQVIEANNARYLFAAKSCGRCGRSRHYFAADNPEWTLENHE